ncbi:pentatricopeptide repeat-containing protein At1g05670, mitochondrial [Fagus crenata]
MNRCSIFFTDHCFRLVSHQSHLGFASNYLPLFCLRRWLSQAHSTSGSTHARPFPDYSPKRPTIRDSEFVHQISTTIKLRRSEPLRRILKPYESKFRPDHLIWVLMNIKNDYKLVLDFFDWVCLRRDPTLEARCIVVQIAVASKDLKLAHELIREFWAKPNLDIGLSYTHFVDRLIYTYKDWGSDPYVFDIFFQVLVEAGMFNEARKLFDKMLNYGLIISVHSCNLFLTRLSNNFDGIEMAIKVFNEYPEVGVCWNTASFNIIIHSLCQLGKIKEAHNLLVQMELRGCMPDVVTYGTILSGYCHVGELKKVLKLIEEMEIKGLKPNPYTYNSIILLLCKTGKVVEAEKVFREMMNRGIIPDNVVYTTLVDGFCKMGNVPTASGNLVQAVNLVKEMEMVGFHPDTITYTTLMDAYCKMGEMAKAHELLREMLDRGLQPTIVTFNVLMNGFCMSGMLDDGERLLKWMLEKGIMPNATTYNSLMKQYCIRNNMRATTEIYRCMSVQGVMPDCNTYNILIKGHCKARNMKEAWFLHREVVEKGFDLTASSYSALIKGFYKRKKFMEARELFEEMRKQGLTAEKEIYNIFVDMNFEEGNMEITLELCDEAIEKCLVDKVKNEKT